MDNQNGARQPYTPITPPSWGAMACKRAFDIVCSLLGLVVLSPLLLVRPGITGLASIRFRNENDLLTASTDPNRTYIEQIMPRKIDLDLEYIPHASVLYDIKLIFQTFAVVIKE